MPEKTDLIDPDAGLPDQRPKMDIKVLQKSNTFSSLSSGGQKLGSWFDRRARKLSMKCSKSITLGKMFWPANWLARLPHDPKGGREVEPSLDAFSSKCCNILE